jgi:nitrile hydratase
MGGMAGFGPVDHENDEDIFHADWEGRVFAMNLATSPFIGPSDYFRFAMESMQPLHYVAASYYERWLVSIERRAIAAGYLSETEIGSGRSVDGKHPGVAAIPPDVIREITHRGASTLREPGRGEPLFKSGDAVVARTIDTQRHSRLPRYAQGRRGVITRYHGNHVYPDTNAHGEGENPQPLYTVRFTARELWGEGVEHRDSVYLDLWEDYLRPFEGDLPRE